MDSLAHFYYKNENNYTLFVHIHIECSHLSLAAYAYLDSNVSESKRDEARYMVQVIIVANSDI